MDLQTLVVWILVACCAVLAARKAMRQVTGSSAGCGACGGCGKPSSRGTACPTDGGQSVSEKGADKASTSAIQALVFRPRKISRG